MKSTTLQHDGNALRATVVPYFGQRKISSINREDIQDFLAEKAKTHSTSTPRSMRIVLGLTLGWAEACRWIERDPCNKIKLPKQTGGRSLSRTFLTAAQVLQISSKRDDLYATLVLFLYSTGLRIGEAASVKWTDFDGNVLTVSRRIYDGDRRSSRRGNFQSRLLCSNGSGCSVRARNGCFDPGRVRPSILAMP